MKNAYITLSIALGRKGITDKLVEQKYKERIEMLDISERNLEKSNKLDSARRDGKKNIITIMVDGKKEILTQRKALEQERKEVNWAYEQIKDEESREKYDELLKQEEQQKKEKAKQPQVESSNKITKLSTRYNQVVRGPNSVKPVVTNIVTRQQQNQTLDVPTVRGKNIRWDKVKWEGSKREDGETR